MKKKLIIIIGIVIVISIAVFIFLKINKGKTPLTNQNQVKITPTPEEAVLWDDPTGFTFSYPKSYALNKHDEDQENYAHVELSKPGEGTIIVWAKDLPLNKKKLPINTIEEWFTLEPRFTGANVIDTSLGGEKAKKVNIANNQSVVMATIFDDLLFYIESSGSGTNITSDFNIVSNSFKFKPLNDESSANEDSSAGEDYSGSVDEEEVLE